MSGRSAGGGGGWRFVRALRLLLAVLLAAAVVIIVVYFLTHLRRSGGTEPVQGELPPQKIQSQKEPIYREFNRDLSRMEISAARNRLQPDGRFRLEGEPGKPVTIIDRGTKGGRDMRFTADRVDYEKGWEKAVFTGNVSIEMRGMTIRADAFAYDKATDLMRSLSAVTIRASRFQGQARSFVYSLRDDSAVLSGEAQFTLIDPKNEKAPFILFGDRIAFNYAQRRARLEGGVRLSHGQSRGRADAVEIQLFAEKDDLHILWLMGNATAALREAKPASSAKAAPKAKPEVPAGPSFQPVFSLESDTQDISADQLMLTAYPDAPSINAVRARGGASFVLIAADGGRTRIQGDAVNFGFNRLGRLEGMTVRGGGSLTARDAGQSGERRLAGNPILYEGSTRVLKAFGSEKTRAISAEPGREISADWILIFMQNNNANASGNLTIVFQREADKAGPSGFFKPGKPAFIRGGFLSYLDKDRSLQVRTAVRMWQDDQILEAPEAAISLQTEVLTATGGAGFRFVQPAGKNRPAAAVQVGGEKMDFDPQSRQVVFRGQGRLRTRDVDLKADLLTVVPDKEPGRARSIQARGTVAIKKGDREAFGEAADYDVEGDTIVLTGHPYLVDKERGTVRGDKLTFRLSDGNIQVENRAQERSEIVIKS
ncbi:MAG: LPS export ABC transporter periplasmic protein LptC [Candidatus Aminicenantes bacterium]|nr:LPS export ABC transporter periplasmic protein LptC [Candidatus Aminicenantes bacterium]